MKEKEKGFGKRDTILLSLCVLALIPTMSYLVNFMGFQKYINLRYTTEQQFNFIGGLIVAMFFGMVIWFIYAVVQMVKNERSASKYREESMKVGDEVRFSGNQSFDAEVLEINGDKAKVVVEIFTSRLYPNK